MAERLDPLALPLVGARLIEASAGTGKTWTIAALYLRLVLGDGRPPLAPELILVTTFTRAATRELSDRIRSRLARAAAVFRGEADADPGDALVPALLARFADQREAAARRLALAADAMDEAAIHTIDAWCQRMLREHAFDSGCLFDEELLADETELRRMAAADVWRREVYPLRGAALAAVYEAWPGFEAFAAGVLSVAPAADAPPLAEAWARAACPLDALRPRLGEALGPLRDWLLGQLAQDGGPFNGSRLRQATVARSFAALAEWAGDAAAGPPDVAADALRRLTPDGLGGCLKKGRTVELPAGFAVFDDLVAALDRHAEAVRALRAAAAARVGARLHELKHAANAWGFEDVQRRLAEALDAASSGAALRRRIVEAHPVALVDEFQDSSLLQAGIFERIWGHGAEGPGALLVIGDPKQSIYAFRGADVRGYLRVRHATAGRHYALGTNHRSTVAVVEVVNRLFGTAESRPGPGAFRMRRGDDDPVPFVAVDARGRDEVLVAEAGALPALEVVHAADQARPASVVIERYAGLCAARMVELLGDPACGFEGPDGFTRLRPSDLAVLVRNRQEAAAVRAALRRRGVASVYLSDRDAVFASPDAADLLRLLRAVAQPRDARLARAAWASALLGLELGELAQLAHDDAAFERRGELLDELHAIWQRHGVLPMLRQALFQLDLPARWLQRDDGERRLTNVLHLAELLQQASTGLDGEQALVEWLEQAVAGRGPGGDEPLMRLESEADLVRVVTVHKSKGLEYPVVFLPFAAVVRDAREAADADDPEAAAEDRRQEELRLLYVALTRARHAMWLGVAAPAVGNAGACALDRSAIGWLLGGDGPHQAADVARLLAAVFGDDPAVRLTPAGEAATVRLPRAEAPRLRAAAAYDARFERDWGIASFTAMVRDLAAAPRRPGLQNLVDEGAAAGVGAPQPRHAFPRGAFAGRFVHDQLAWLAEQGFGTGAQWREALGQRAVRAGWGAHAAALGSWLDEVAAAPLPCGGTLRDLESCIAEMEFWFPLGVADRAAVGALCAEVLPPSVSPQALGERRLRGLLMGFADLVFEHDGRWWVLDYKTNALGPGDADYTAQAIAEEVASHRYDVQAMLYLLALHRLLRRRLGEGYDPARQLGGAIDLFVRGIRGPAGGCFTIEADVDLLARLDALVEGEGGDG